MNLHGFSLWQPLTYVLPSTSASVSAPNQMDPPPEIEEVLIDSLQPLLSENTCDAHNGILGQISTISNLDDPPMDPERARPFEDPLTLPTPAHACTKCHKNFFTYTKSTKQQSPIMDPHLQKLSLSAQSSDANSSLSKVFVRSDD